MKRAEQILKLLRRKYRSRLKRNQEPFWTLMFTVLSARNTDASTLKATEKLFSCYPSMREISNAPIRKLEEILRNIGLYRQKAKRVKAICRILLEKYSGQVPDTMEALTTLPGVGRKTAGCVLVFAYNKQAIPVDTHVHRVSNRLGIVQTKTPEKTEFALMEIIPEKAWIDVNQLLIRQGRKICKPIRPLCQECLVRRYCDYYKSLNRNEKPL